MARPMRLGDLLLRAGVVSDEQLQRGLSQQERWGGKLGTILVRMGALTEDLLVKALSRQLNIPRADLTQINIPPPLRSRLTREVCQEYGVIPVRYDSERRCVLMAVSDPFNVVILDDLSRRINLRVEPLLAGEQAIVDAIKAQYTAREPPSADTGIKLLDNQGSTLIKKRNEIGPAGQPPGVVAPVSAPHMGNQVRSEPRVPRSTATPPPGPAPGTGAELTARPEAADLERLAQKQAKALRAVLELLIEKGVLTREEYLAWVNRR